MMKWFGIFVLTLVSIPSWGQNLPKEWKLVEYPGVERAWVNSKNPGHSIILVKNRTRESMSLKGSSKNQILSGILAFRSITLTQFGFTDFKVANFSYAHGAVDKIELQGSYNRPGNVAVKFFEKQYFNENQFHQVSYFVEGRAQKLNLREIETLLEKVGVSQRLPADESSAIPSANLEASIQESCIDCQLPKTPGLDEVAKQAEELAKTTDQCATDSWLFDPDKKSVLQENGLLRVTESRLETAARAFLTCNYGSLTGAAKSFRDVVMAVPNLLGLTWNGMKSAGNALSSFEYRKWLESFSIQKVTDTASGVLSVTKDTVSNAFMSASLKAYSAYKEGGVTGSVAAVAQAAMNSSPHKAIGQFLSKIGSEIYSALATEWSGLMCMEPEALSQAMCEIAGYLAVDVVTGKLLLSGLSKSGKIKEAIAAVRKKMEKVPIASEIITRNLKSIDGSRCGKFQDSDWKVDSGFKLQGQDINVLREGALILARGISPKSGKLECFEVGGGLATKIEARIAATEKRGEQIQSGSNDYFSPGSSSYARTSDEFVEGVNAKAGVEVSGREAKKISTALSKDPDAMEQYGALTRNLHELKEKEKIPGLAKEDLVALQVSIRHAEESLRMVNSSLPHLELASQLNMKSISEAMIVASATKPEQLQLINRALYEFNKAAKDNSGNFKASLEVWEFALKKERKHLTSKDIDRAKECLFNTGTR